MGRDEGKAMNEVPSTKAFKLFLCCIEFHDETEPDELAIGDVLQEEGEFQIVLLARDLPDATERLKARLDEIARTSDAFGPILVWVNSVIELGEQDLSEGRAREPYRLHGRLHLPQRAP